MNDMTAPFILGRREWVALPALGLFAVRAKVDTGARTSALHAREIEVIGAAPALRVRFLVHPLPEHPEIEIACEADLQGRRDVTSSIGESETRYIIRTQLRVGARSWEIELGLTNREAMTHRMLLGRQAILPGMLVDPASSYLQPRLGPRNYR